MSKNSFIAFSIDPHVQAAIELEARRLNVTTGQHLERILLDHVVSVSTIYGGMIADMRQGIRELNVGCEGTLRDFIGDNWKIVSVPERRIFAEFVHQEVLSGRLDWIESTGVTVRKHHRLYRIVKHPERVPMLSDNRWW